MGEGQADVHAALRTLAAAYASGVDTRNPELLLSAFDEDATLEVFGESFEPVAPRSVMRGHGEIARITSLVGRFAATFHLLGQGRYQVTGDRATGEVYCVAHHYTPTTDGHETMTMYIRYEDDYRRDDDRGWKITRRQVRPSWTEIRQVLRPTAVEHGS